MLESNFFTKFLQLSDFRTLAFIVALIALFKVINVLQKKKVSFSTRMITGTVLGLILGVIVQVVANFPDSPKDITWINQLSGWYSFVGGGFIDLLKMLVVPLIFLSIIRVIMNMQGDNLGKLTTRTIGALIGLTAIAAIIGIALATLFNLGQGFDAANNTAEIREAVSLTETIRGLLPSNIVSSMAEGNIVGVVIFSAFVGTSIRRLSKKHAETIEPFVKWVEASYKIIISVTMTIIKFMPYAVVALLANTIISNGIGVLASVGKFIACLYLAVFQTNSLLFTKPFIHPLYEAITKLFLSISIFIFPSLAYCLHDNTNSFTAILF